MAASQVTPGAAIKLGLDELQAIFERLPFIEQALTVSRLSREWREWSDARCGPWCGPGDGAIAGDQDSEAHRDAASGPDAASTCARCGSRRARLEASSPRAPLWAVRDHWPGLSWRQELVAVQRAARHGDLEVLQWLHQAGLYTFHAGGLTVLTLAAHGHADALRWAADEAGALWHEDACAAAARGGHLGVLAVAHARGRLAPEERERCRRAAKGDPAVCEWLDGLMLLDLALE
ncbi:hypothetical protein MNEG_11880 [Monoraphidium neglectum]|jgi:hypothetical protein|uniref:F-box domain-containing protein n=1 Tax=Monoraphidium neglectum TaxID=145388 RepID=A0A0D2M472_9CHLO|nr:hypothetical protein MNEG_11880 [Monoraphidium neglectum]KIY96081.1 hypothetical protein MNEG_11880 [Monoraphidium neglectum]|eukprot:XP_013895101.1 hypothetical protein MNEG_11880 [Monoraphidium neglectum]